MTKEELEIAKAAYCVGKIWDTYEGKENFDHMVGLRVKHLIELVLNYQKPSLPSSLDEAAKKAYKEYDVKTAVKPKEHPVGFLFFDGFKAGAEWMAGQGVNADFGVCKLANKAWLTPIDEKRFMQDIFGNFGAGDKVVVQIRKK